MNWKVWLWPIALGIALSGLYVGLHDQLEEWGQMARDQGMRSSSTHLALIDSAGAHHQLSEYLGKWVVVFFGYTNCPDICPMSLSYANREYNELGELADQVRVVFISIDPARDRESVSKFVAYFNKSFVGLTATDEVLHEITETFKTGYARDESTSKLGYLMTHSADFFIVDPTGLLRERLHAPHEHGQLKNALTTFIHGGAS